MGRYDNCKKAMGECLDAFGAEFIRNVTHDMMLGWTGIVKEQAALSLSLIHSFRTGRKRTERKLELMAIFSVEAISEITSINSKFCRIKRATFTCYFCNTAISVCDARVATAMADNGETPICPICGKKTICSLYEFQSHENPNIIEDVDVYKRQVLQRMRSIS